MKRLATIGCGTALTLGVLAGCGSDEGGGDSENAGGSSGGDYCGLIEDAKGEFSGLDDPSVEDMNQLESQVGEIADAAPEDVQSDWKKLGSVLGDMSSAFEELGIATDEPLSKAAQDVDPKKAEDVMKPLLADVQSMKSAQQAIDENVKQECDIDLNSGSSQ